MATVLNHDNGIRLLASKESIQEPLLLHGLGFEFRVWVSVILSSSLKCLSHLIPMPWIGGCTIYSYLSIYLLYYGG